MTTKVRKKMGRFGKNRPKKAREKEGAICFRIHYFTRGILRAVRVHKIIVSQVI